MKEKVKQAEPIENENIKQAEEKAQENPIEEAQLKEMVQALTAENEALLAEAEESKKALETANAKADAYLGKLASLKGDYERLKARSAASLECAKAEGKAQVIEKLLPVLDTFDRAKQSVKDENTLNALDLILKQFEKLLSDAGITEIEVIGQPFDPNIANAVIKQPVEDEQKKGTVIGVVSKGFRYGDKVIRYPQVSVGV